MHETIDIVGGHSRPDKFFCEPESIYYKLAGFSYSGYIFWCLEFYTVIPQVEIGYAKSMSRLTDHAASFVFEPAAAWTKVVAACYKFFFHDFLLPLGQAEPVDRMSF